MRCPKCGFISFDQVESCSKCGHDVSKVTGELKGTALKTQFSFFLGSVIGGHLAGDTAEETSPPEEMGIDSDISAENEETVEEEQLEIQFDADEKEFDSADLSLDEEVTESPEIDFSGFEDDESGEESALQEDLNLEDEGMADLQLSDDEAEPKSVVDIPDEPERGVKLNIEVDMEDEPDQLEVALDEIDLSDLVIEDEEKPDSAKLGEESGAEEILELESLSLDGMKDQGDSDMFDMSLGDESEENSENGDEEIASLVLEDDSEIGELKIESAGSKEA